MDWEDLRLLLALARTGTTVGAGRELKLAHTTVSRRIAAIEEAIGHALFVRTPDGMRLNDEGRAMIELARPVEEAMLRFERRLAQLGDRVEGTVRIATNLPLAELLLANLNGLRDRAPELTLELLVGQGLVDLARHEADLALRTVRPGRPPAEPSVIARRLGTCGFAVFGSAAYFARRGEPAAPVRDLAGHDLVTFGASSPAVPGAALIAAATDTARQVVVTDTMHCAAAAVAAGHGLGVLLCALRELEPRLVQLSEPVDWDEVYLAFPADLQDVPRVRLVVDEIVRVFEERAAVLRGDV